MKKITYLAIVVLLVFGGVVLVKNKKAELASKPLMEEFALNAKIFHPIEKQGDIRVQALAGVKSEGVVQYSSKLPLRVLHIVSMAESLKKGALLLELDNQDILHDVQNVALEIENSRIDLSSKTLQLKTLQTNHERSLKLQSVGGISPEQIANEEVAIESPLFATKAVESKIEILKNKKAQLKNLLSYTKFYAPFDGIVVERNVEQGEIATPFKGLLSFANEKRRYFELELPSSIEPKGIIYEGAKIALQKLPVAKNSMNRYISNEVAIKESIGTTMSIDLVLYEGLGYFLPNNSFLQINSKSYLLLYENEKVTKREIAFLACGNTGCVSREDLSGLSLLQAKPDAMLKVLSGMKIAIKE